jgi:hypothetical protein
MVMLNFSGKAEKCQLEADLAGSKWEILASTHGRSGMAEPRKALVLNGDEVLVLLKLS